jgi:hypothetical protein
VKFTVLPHFAPKLHARVVIFSRNTYIQIRHVAVRHVSHPFPHPLRQSVNATKTTATLGGYSMGLSILLLLQIPSAVPKQSRAKHSTSVLQCLANLLPLNCAVGDHTFAARCGSCKLTLFFSFKDIAIPGGSGVKPSRIACKARSLWRASPSRSLAKVVLL